MRLARLTAAMLALAIGLTAWGPGAFRLAAGENDTPEGNPYLAPSGLAGAELLTYIQRMQERPESIRARPGFAAAVDDAVERLLASMPADAARRQAQLARFAALHFAGCAGNNTADERLKELAGALCRDGDETVARVATRYDVEFRALALTAEQATECELILAEIRKVLAGQKLDESYLRMASAVSHVVNLIADDKVATQYLEEFGGLFAASDDKALARAGRQMQKAAGQPRPEAPKAIDLVGKTLDLKGVTVEGLDFDWSSYRGKVVLVDFWATWCGPCRAELPNVIEQYKTYHERGFEVVGISLDRTREDLETFLAEQPLPWVTLFSDTDDGRHPMAVKYDVQAIPLAILVDREGKVVSQAARGKRLIGLLAEQLGPPEGESK